MYKVMIVDDEILVRIGLKSMIDWEKAGFQIVGEAGNGEAAYEKFLVLKPDILITDIKMPHKDGFWLIKKVKEAYPKTEIIVLTAYDEFDYVRNAMKLHASDYLLKAEMEEQEIEELMSEKKEKLDLDRRGKEEKYVDIEAETERSRELIFGLLLDSHKPLELLKKQFAEQQIPWNVHKYCFVQFDFETALCEGKYSQEQSASILFACKQLIAVCFLEKYEFCFSKQFGKSITCFLMAKKITQESLLEDIEEIQKSIGQYFNICFKSASSQIEASIEQVRDNSGWIYQAADILFCVEAGGHITQEETQEETGGLLYREEQTAELAECLLNADEEGSREILREIRENASKWRASTLDLKLKMVQFMNLVTQSCREYLDGKNEELLKYQKEILNAVDLEELFRIVQKYQKCILDAVLKSTMGTMEVLMGKAVVYMENHYKEKLSLEEVANYVGLSQYYFSNLFKKTKGVKFSSYLNEVRIDEAKKMLRNPKITIAKICEEVGFNDQPYFSKNFKKYTGMTVTEYRENYLKDQ